jgi:hypothetical protein
MQNRPRGKTEKKDGQALLEDRQKLTMIATLIRNVSAFSTVRHRLQVRHFDNMGKMFGVLWEVMENFYELHRTLPTRGLIRDHIMQLLADMPQGIGDDEIAEMDKFLDWAFDDKEHDCDLSRSRVHRVNAIEICRRFIAEHVVLDVQRTICKGDSIDPEARAHLEAAHTEITLAHGIGTQSERAVFTGSWDSERTPLVPTGIKIIDDLIGGGHSGDESYLFMAPYGTCKTVVAIQLAALAAKAAEAEFVAGKTNGRLPQAYFVTTEIVVGQFRDRILAFMAQIPITKLRRRTSVKELDSSLRPAATEATAYEKRIYSKWKPGDAFDNEQQRVAAAVDRCNHYLRFVNLTGDNKENTKAGANGILDVVSAIQLDMDEDKRIYPSVVVLDHAMALVHRQIALSTSLYNDDIRVELEKLPMLAKDHIVSRFKCPLWVFHQLSGEHNAKSGPLAEVNHGHAAGCRSIGQYFDFALEIGGLNIDQVGLLRCTKHRREPPRPYQLVRVDGDFARIVDASGTHMLDDSKRHIMRIDEAARLGMDKNTKKNKRKPKVRADL